MKKRCRAYLILLALSFAAIAEAAPTITVWYGNNQSFGQTGNPQAAINILGNVTDPNGISSLSYTLNGGSSSSLSMGGPNRRLLRPGDFNIDINTSSLNNGTNTIVISATNTLSETSTSTVTVQYQSGQMWPLPYTANWSSASAIADIAQVVDGQWILSGGTIRPKYLGYDRLVAIGDKTWTDYEVTVPITIYSVDTAGYPLPSNGPGVGIIFRWTGHTDNPLAGWQPKSGYLPLGAIGWLFWNNPNDTNSVQLTLLGNNLSTLSVSNFTPTRGVTYVFKMRVETIAGVGGLYKFKVWQQGQSEPDWMAQGQQSLSDPQSGSVLLVSHHVSAEFGTVTITPPSTTPIQLSSFTATLSSPGTVRLDWTTLSETNNFGFNIQRSLDAAENFQTIPNSFVRGHGTTLDPHRYSYSDEPAGPGNWYYRLEQIDLDGTRHYPDPVQIRITTGVPVRTAPSTFKLDQNYPNPFNPSTVITFEIPKQGPVKMEVFNPIGQKVADLVDEDKPAGVYSVRFDGSALTSGVYICRLAAAGNTLSSKMLLMK